MSKKSNTVALDIECYVNYFLVLVKSEDGRIVRASMHNDKVDGNLAVMKSVITKSEVVTFNGENYDIPMVSAFLAGWTNAELKALSDTIIVDDVPRWKLADTYPKLRILRLAKGHVDLVGVTPLQASLKAYGCRIHSRKLQDLPIDPSALISDNDAKVLEKYCENDVDVTWDIYRTMTPELDLRRDMTKTYAINMLSKSDPQIAEAIIKHYMEEREHKVEKREGKVKPFKYTIPDFIKFKTTELQQVLETVRGCTFKVKPTGNVELPDAISQVIEFAGAKYKLGIGGLHSQEKRQVVKPTADQVLGEYDVASMYPSIILGQNLYPKHLGEAFLEVYREIFNERMAAKRSGNKTTADTLKIVLNASYGKFGSKYSFLYSPELLIQTTLSGQLALLRLIEAITHVGGQVVSANTDGVVVLMDKSRKPKIDGVCDQWTKQTSYLLEWTEYRALYSESVNSYVALKPEGGAKTKGLYESGSIRKGYSAQVCNDAVVAYLKDNVPVDETIRSCTDVRQFLIMRGVRGGAVWKGEALGKVVRWYIGTEGEAIRYSTNGNKVAGSDGAVPMMDIVESLPYDLDLDRYVEIAKQKLKRLGL